jgi:hypothetical protein
LVWCWILREVCRFHPGSLTCSDKDYENILSTRNNTCL